MLLKTHLLFSSLIWLGLNFVVEVPWWTVIIVLVATAFVDIDEKNSTVGKSWIFRPIQFIVKHRGLFHSLFAALFISVLVAAINRWAGFSFFVGYISHLFIDCFTPAGVRLFWPLKFRIKGPIRSGKLFETILFVNLILANIILIIWMIIN